MSQWQAPGPEGASGEVAADAPRPDRTSQLVQRGISLVFCLGGAWVCWTSLGMGYYTSIGPGPGFFPFWSGLALAFFSLLVLLGSFDVRELFAERFVAPPDALMRVIVTLLAVAGFAVLVERIGFVLTTFAMMFGLLLAGGCRMLPTGLLVALGGSLGIGFAFSRWLGVYIPPAPFGLLSVLGM